MLSRAHTLIENYKENGVRSDRILIRLPATWQGIQAAKQLESEGIAAHVTLIYRLASGATFLQLCGSMLVAVIKPCWCHWFERASYRSLQWHNYSRCVHRFAALSRHRLQHKQV